MSFSVSCARHSLEYAGRRPFGHAPARLIREITRFLREARGTIASAREQTVGGYVAEHGYSPQFRDHFLVPLTVVALVERHRRGARLPGRLHALVLRHARDARLPAEAVADGRRRLAGLRRRAARALAGASCTSGCRCARSRARPDGVEVRTADGEARRFDGVVLAVHGDQALPLLADPDADERRVLSAFRSTANETVLHTDERLLPRAGLGRRGTIGSPTARRRTATRRSRTTSTASRLSTPTEHYCVTLNRTDEIDESRVIRRIAYEHPLYTFESLRGAARAAGAEPRPDRVRRRVAGRRASTRTGSPPGCGAAATFGVEW